MRQKLRWGPAMWVLTGSPGHSVCYAKFDKHCTSPEPWVTPLFCPLPHSSGLMMICQVSWILLTRGKCKIQLATHSVWAWLLSIWVSSSTPLNTKCKPSPFRVNIGNSDNFWRLNHIQVAGTQIRAECTACDRSRENQPPHMCIQRPGILYQLLWWPEEREENLFLGGGIVLRRKQLLVRVYEVTQANNFKEEKIAVGRETWIVFEQVRPSGILRINWPALWLERLSELWTCLIK